MQRRLSDSIGTVEKLKEALLSCLNEQEYDSVTVSRLSACAGINRTTFYLLCDSKDELFVELCRSLIDRWFQLFFDLNMAKNNEKEREMFHQLLGWIRQWSPALKRVLRVRTEQFDGFSLLTAGIEKKMLVQSVFKTEDKMIQMKYDLFTKIYAIGLISILKWWLEEGEDFEEDAFYGMIERLRYKGYYSILGDE